MPKEIVRSYEPVALTKQEVEEYEAAGGERDVVGKIYTQAELGWSREAYFAQLGVTIEDPSIDWEKRGYFIQLDRDGINRLIRALRKARDQVFGKDA